MIFLSQTFNLSMLPDRETEIICTPLSGRKVCDLLQGGYSTLYQSSVVDDLYSNVLEMKIHSFLYFQPTNNEFHLTANDLLICGQTSKTREVIWRLIQIRD